MWPVQVYALVVLLGIVLGYVSVRSRSMDYVFASFSTVLLIAAALNSSSIAYNGSTYELLGLRMVWFFAAIIMMIHTFVLAYESVSNEGYGRN